jgi:hypothetical protein
MRIVTDSKGENWICLQVPPRPGTLEGWVIVECNSGAERTEIVVPAAWEELPDAEVLGLIGRALGRG